MLKIDTEVARRFPVVFEFDNRILDPFLPEHEIRRPVLADGGQVVCRGKRITLRFLSSVDDLAHHDFTVAHPEADAAGATLSTLAWTRNMIVEAIERCHADLACRQGPERYYWKSQYEVDGFAISERGVVYPHFREGNA